MFKPYTYIALLLTLSLFASCTKDDGYVGVDPELISPVVFNIDSLPYDNLSEYNFFEGNIADLNPVYGVLPYGLNSALFSDYANKKRFVWMPKDSTAKYVNDYTTFDFPVGTILIKNFYYDNVLPDMSTKIIETRLMIKLEDDWTFANYVWNEEQTDATFTTQSKFLAFDWELNGETKSVNYKIPGFPECFTCHNKYDTPLPIGPKPQNINRNYLYPEGSKNQLAKWVEQGYLEDNYPSEIKSLVEWDDESQPLDLRVRSYFDINCAHCHSDQSYCEYASMRFEFNKTEDISNLGVCVESVFYINPSITHIVNPGITQRSALFFRISSDEDQYKMPLIGRTLNHIEGIELIEEWINSLTQNCN
ncbi:MAG: hypothetical protein R2785_07655 [Flavobacteriaceae bacterium]